MASPEEPRFVLRAGALELEPLAARVTLGGAALRLTRTEFRLLEALMAAAGVAVSRAELSGAARSRPAALRGWPLEASMYGLRGKLRRAAAEAGVVPPVIERVPKLGYRLRV